MKRRRNSLIERLEPRQLLSASLVKDINTGAPLSPGLQGGISAGGIAFLSQDDGVAGWELYKSDGTAAGTQLVKDIRPGRDNSQPGWFAYSGSGTTMYFTADDGVHGFELWKSDGTTAGTVMVKDINPGSGASSPSALTVINGTLYFAASDGVNGFELWRSDGTAAGTVMVKDIAAAAGASSSPSLLINNNGTLFFRASDGSSGFELWKSDGTAAGTVLVKDIASFSGNGMSQNIPMVVHNGFVYFTGTSSTSNTEVWRSDGTSLATTMVKDITAGSSGSTPRDFRVSGNYVYFNTNGGTAIGQWRTDGTDAGTLRIGDNAFGMTDINGTLFYGQGTSLFRTDGVAVGGVITPTTVRSGLTFNSIAAQLWTNFNGTYLFTADDGSGAGEELWKSDGTPGGTQLVKDVEPGPTGSRPFWFIPYGPGGTSGVIFATLGGAQIGSLFKSDGTAAGTGLLKDVNASTGDSAPIFLTPFKNHLYFVAFEPGYGMTGGGELYRTDGTAAGTGIFLDLNVGPVGGSITSLKAMGDWLYFSGNDPALNAGAELWRTNGSVLEFVKDINPGSANSSISAPTVSGNYLFFRATNTADGEELWRTDGTNFGTIRMSNLASTVGVGTVVDVNGRLYFTSTVQTSGAYSGLWWSDGWGSVGVANTFTNVSGMVNVNGTLYIAGTTPTDGSRLFKIGPGDTQPVLVANPLNAAGAGNLTDVNGTLFFSASTSATGVELFKVDPATGQIALVKNIRGGTSSSSPSFIVSANGVAYFRADDGVVGQELWRSDGTDAGTHLVKDINPAIVPGPPPAPANSGITRAMFAYNGYVYFAADDGVNGLEGWRSDGTTAGTQMIGDYFPELSQFNVPSNFAFPTAFAGDVYYRFTDETYGTELWKAEQPDFATLGAGGALTIAATGGDDVINIAADGAGNVTITLNGLVETFAPGQVASINVVGHTGNDALTVSGGTVTFGGNVGAGTANLSLRVAPGASAVFNASQRLRHLDVDGSATLTAGGAKLIITKGLEVGGRLNLADNDLVLDYDPAGPDPLRAVEAMIGGAYNFGAWDLPGIHTDMADATQRGITTLAVADPFAIFGLGPSDTMEFGGVTVDGTSVLVKYTYAGDLNLDGLVDGADYGTIDNWVQFPGTSGYWNGDFNFDGVIDGADYGIIDNSVQLQSGPL